MVIIPKILVLLFIDASHVKKSGHRQTLKNGTCGDRTLDLEGGTPIALANRAMKAKKMDISVYKL